MQHLQSLARNPKTIDRNTSFGVYMNDNGAFAVNGVYLGPLKVFEDTFESALLRGLPVPEYKIVKEFGWIDSLRDLGGGNLVQPLQGYDEHDNFYANSITIPEENPFSNDTLEFYRQYLSGRISYPSERESNQTPFPPPTSWFAIANIAGGHDSQINIRDTKFAAYKDRNALWVIQHYAHVPQDKLFPEEGVEWLKSLHRSLQSLQNGTMAYLNYMDPEIKESEARDMYYGQSLHDRLLDLKDRIDPTDLFSNPASVKRSPQGPTERPNLCALGMPPCAPIVHEEN